MGSSVCSMVVVAKFVALSKFGKCFNTSEARLADQLCEGSKAFLRADAKQFVLDHPDEPMLRSVGYDGTPLTTMLMRHCTFVGKRLIRKGKQLGDFVSGRLFLQIPSGEMRVVFTEPTHMQDHMHMHVVLHATPALPDHSPISQ